MGWDLERPFSSQTVQIAVLYLLRAFLVIAVLRFLFRAYRKRKVFQDAVDEFPHLQLRPLNFLGHLSILTNFYLFTYPAPFFAYHSILMSGLAKAYGKNGVVLIWQASYPLLVVYKADVAEIILSHSTEIRKAWFYDFLKPWLGEGLLTSDGEQWRHRRKLLTSSFHFNILKDFLPVINKESRILVNILQQHTDSKYVDIVPLITRCSFDIICETILGEEMHSQTQEECDYLKSVVAITDIMSDRALKPWLWPDIAFYFSSDGRKQRFYLKQIKAFANELIAKKKKEKLETRLRCQGNSKDSKNAEEMDERRKRRALLDLLLDEHIDKNSISLDEIREEVDTFTFEGHDTTSMAMSWVLYLIGLHPEVQAKIHAELDSIFGDDDRDPTSDDLRDMKYLECAFKESLRLYPSVPGYGREVQHGLEINGLKIPKECSCLVWVHALHRDPDVFPNPEVFDPDRFSPENVAGRHPFAYLPFSAGPRNCIGQKFALLEEKCVVSAILRKYTIRSVQPRDCVHDTFVVVLRPYGGVKLEIRDRKPKVP